MHFGLKDGLNSNPDITHVKLVGHALQRRPECSKAVVVLAIELVRILSN